MSTSHLLIILVIVVILFGGSRLEGLGSGMGKAIRNFKKGLEGDDEKPANSGDKAKTDHDKIDKKDA
jgi:sec-independent protein translocase protein TatA